MLVRSGMFRCLSINLFFFLVQLICSFFWFHLRAISCGGASNHQSAQTSIPLSEPYWNASAFFWVPLRKICPKIEKPQALTNIEGIIEKSQALMVARQPWDEGPGAWFVDPCGRH
jgi:hypothetical protein